MHIKMDTFNHVCDGIQEKLSKINIFPRQFKQESDMIFMSHGRVLQHSTSDIIRRWFFFKYNFGGPQEKLKTSPLVF